MRKGLYFETIIGRFGVIAEDGMIARVLLPGEEEDFEAGDDEILKETRSQIEEYLEGERKDFSVPLYRTGSDFYVSVWKALEEIPYGETRTYQEIAEEIGNKDAARAVGSACNANPLPILVPCHRVIGKNGKLTGYRGGLGIKSQLLELERMLKQEGV